MSFEIPWKLLLNIFILVFIVLCQHLLFQYTAVPVFNQDGASGLPVFVPELVFVLTSFILFCFVPYSRSLFLVSFAMAQGTLYFTSAIYNIAGFPMPYYALIAINGVYLLVLYFWFSGEKWSPKEIDPEEFDPSLKEE